MVTQLHFIVPADPSSDESKRRTAGKKLTTLECHIRRHMENLRGAVLQFPQLSQFASEVQSPHLNQLAALSRHIPCGPARYADTFSQVLELFINALIFTNPKEKKEEREAAGKRLRKWWFILGQNDINVFRPIRIVLALKALDENRQEDFDSFLRHSLGLKSNVRHIQSYYSAFWKIVARSRRWWDIDLEDLYLYLRIAMLNQSKRDRRDLEIEQKPYAGNELFKPLDHLTTQFRTPCKATTPASFTEELVRQRELFEIFDALASPRQKQIIELLLESRDRKEIAKLLNCSRSTVDVQISRLKEKIRSSPL